MQNLLYRHEEALFYISVVISSFFWFAIILGTLGIALLYVFLFYIFYLFAQSAFISYLKGNGVKITETQFPDLYEKVRHSCSKVGLSKQPEAYLIHADGIFNALATRFRGRNFIVLFSDIVDAMEDDSEALNFYIGHELGHIHRKHLIWGPILFPAGMMPLVGAAYSRAREYTCDRYGLACCPNPQSAANGLAALAAGEKRWKTLNFQRYTAQTDETRGFWMSFHELTADYPWLVKRVGRILSPDHFSPPRRHWFAWMLAAITPRFGGGGATSLMITVAVIGMMAAIAIPQFATYRTMAYTSSALAEARNAAEAVETYYEKNQAVPPSLQEIGINETPDIPGIERLELDENGVISVTMNVDPVDGKALIYEPRLNDDNEIFWICSSDEIEDHFLPPECK